MIERLRGEVGYSLVEVMASIIILSIAIIPMVGMFDMGLNAATKGSTYDKARTYANQRLETAKSMTYADVRSSFPVSSSTPTGGSYTSSAQTVPTAAGLPSGSTYTVTKQYVTATGSSFGTATSDSGLMRVSITVNWSGNSYTTIGLKAL